MTYNELIDRMSEELGLSKAETRRLMKDVVGEFTDQLGEGTGFSIPDLGTFKTRIKEVQKIYNPHHKKYMMVPPKQIVEYSPAKNMKEKLKYIATGDE